MADTDALSELQVFAATLDGEAGNQGYEGQQAVANVIMQRVKMQWQRETTVRGVCLHPYQFSCWLPGPDRDRIMASTNPQCLEIAQLAIDGNLLNIVDEADSYCVTGTNPYWAAKLVPVAVIGAHSFYITK